MTTWALTELERLPGPEPAAVGLAIAPDKAAAWFFTDALIHEVDPATFNELNAFGPFDYLPPGTLTRIVDGAFAEGLLFLAGCHDAAPTTSGLLLVIDPSTGNLEQTVDLVAMGVGEPAAVAVDVDSRTIWVTSRTTVNRLWPIDLDTYAPAAPVDCPTGGRIVGMAVHPDGSVWLAESPDQEPSEQLREIVLLRADPAAGTREVIAVHVVMHDVGGIAFAVPADPETPLELYWAQHGEVFRYEVAEPEPEPPPPEPPPPVVYEPPEPATVYASVLEQLLPPGRLWDLEPLSTLRRLMLGMADELARVAGRVADMQRERLPSTAVETLPDWERCLGIAPPVGATMSERQVAAAAKLVARGGATATYLEGVAARLGFVATIAVPAPNTMRMDVDLAASSATYTLRVSVARAGSARAGDRVANRDVAELENEINRIKPAHVTALFAYT